MHAPGASATVTAAADTASATVTHSIHKARRTLG